VSTATRTATRPEGQQRSPAERLIETVGGLSLLGRTDVAVYVGRDRVGRVTEVLLDDLRVRAGREQEAGRRPAQSVQGDAAEAGSLARTSKRRRTLRGSSGVPISVVKTSRIR
jgi:hypothetical protein